MTQGSDPSQGGRDRAARSRQADLSRRINAILDAEAEGQLHQSRKLTGAAREAHPDLDQHLSRTRDSLSSLAVLPKSPDFAPTLLAELDRQGVITPRRTRRRVSAARVALVCGALATFTVSMLLQRYAPPPIEPRGAPVSGLVTTAQADFANSVESVGQAVLDIRQGLFAPVGSLVASRDRSSTRLEFGNAASYEVGSSLAHGPTRLALISVPTNAREAFPAPTHRVAQAPSLASATISPLVPEIAPSLLQPSDPAARVSVPSDAWLLWDGGRWVMPPREGRR